MKHNIHFAGRLMGVHGKNLPTDYENMIVIYGNTPWKHEGACLWTYHVTRMATKEEFAASKLADSHPDVTFCLNQFAENCLTEFRLTEMDTEEYKAIYRQIRKGEHQIRDLWPGNPATFLHLHGMEHSVNYSIDHGYELDVEIEFLKLLGPFIEKSLNTHKDSGNAVKERSALTEMKRHLEIPNATNEELIGRISELAENPPAGIEAARHLCKLRYLNGCNSYTHPLSETYHDMRRKRHTEYMIAEYAKDKEIILDAIHARIKQWCIS
ncbi:hypothetical protein MKR81_27225 (plasmid) [Vibrio campbellii]|uniref:hypothetical protein n=1 Tax=Vibrio campbellii TaxID=680 RepID=UPI001F084939|nr:hypothetical protein [Vibrio campbellii]UMM06642.1 hypothetical protein MKR81_27225 [Vibrio campbellii]